jgi:hypothetical protein
MKNRLRTRRATFEVIGQNSVNQTWDGSPLVLNPQDSANMPTTPVGSMVFAYTNISTVNNMGTLALVSGGSAPTFLTAPAFTNQPGIIVKNWQGQNLGVTNVSVPGTNTPIEIAAYGPGMPGQTCVALPADNTPVALAALQCAQGTSQPWYMQLTLEQDSAQFAVFILIGGPPDSSGNNAYTIAVNFTENTGPGTGQPPPPGYYATTTANSYLFSFNWGVSMLYVANMSSTTSAAARVKLRKL